MFDVIVIGGGAAGIFAAIWAKETAPKVKVLLLEKGGTLLNKVRISGGGRCNTTHACFDPKELVKRYPRGHRELLGPFHTFGPKECVRWFQKEGVPLKKEADGRMFPITDDSKTIIDALLDKAKKVGVEIWTKAKIEAIEKGFTLKLKDGRSLKTRSLVLSTGSGREGYQLAKQLGHTIVDPVPSLFTFNVPSSPFKELSGIAIEKVALQVGKVKRSEEGPLLLTHFGFSGPPAIRLSAWAARELFKVGYQESLHINWMAGASEENLAGRLLKEKEKQPHKSLGALNPFKFPKAFWVKFIQLFSLDPTNAIKQFKDKDLRRIASKLHHDTYQVDGKTTHKEEFVTCGGVALKEIDFKRMESKCCPNLYFAGEILDIDGVTGGFNFQNAWTTGFIAGSSAGEKSLLNET